MRLFTELNREGITVVVVTHEPDIALWAGRRITFRDGRIVDDVRQTPITSGELLSQDEARALVSDRRASGGTS
jgi:putative ABC transport system ATP-binding protein